MEACLAAIYGSLVDEIYWNLIDGRCDEPFTSIEERICRLLNEEERDNLDHHVPIKLQDINQGTLDIYHNVDDLVSL